MNPWIHGASYAVIAGSFILATTAIGTWFERKLAGRMQSRLGPTMVGPLGLLQPIADLLKLLQKEDIRPTQADRTLFRIAPVLAALCALGVAAVVPFAPDLVAADLDVGVPFVLALGGLTSVAIFMAGWASNNKLSLLAGMRSVAQTISYEVPLLLTSMVPCILAGSMNLGDIVRWQAENQWIAIWPILPGLPAFILFFIATLAESNRIPFDIPEAESELVAGVTTEYTGMKFALFYLGEYVHTLVSAAVGAALFLGGWDGPFAPGLHWMVAKTAMLFAVLYWVRWTLLRLRSDQLLVICWRWLVPVSIGLVLAAAVWVQIFPGVRS